MAYLIEDETEPEVTEAGYEAPCPCGCGLMIEPEDYVTHDPAYGWVLADHPDGY